MTLAEWLQIALYFGVLLLCVRPLGAYMAAIYEGRTPGPARWLRPLESGIYRICGVRPDEESPWKRYAIDMLLFHLVGFVTLYSLQRVQGREREVLGRDGPKGRRPAARLRANSSKLNLPELA